MVLPAVVRLAVNAHQAGAVVFFPQASVYPRLIWLVGVGLVGWCSVGGLSFDGDVWGRRVEILTRRGNSKNT